MNYYIYLHKRKDTGIVFYIGRGTKDRAKRGARVRNNEWKKVCEEAGGFEIEYIAQNLNLQKAIELENFYLLNPDISWNLTNIKREEVVKDLTGLINKLNFYFEYNENSPSCLIWKNKYKTSKIKVGDSAGYFNKSHGYYEISVEGNRYYVHRIIYIMHHGEIDNSLVIDHIDKNRCNNKISNLRIVSKSDNVRNRTIIPNTKTNHVGVQFRVNAVGNEYYQASYTEDGKAKVKLFSVKKLGKEKALQSAIDYRKEKHAE
jgi:hypothetical protein